MATGGWCGWQRPPIASIAATFSGLVERGTTATNSTPTSRAKWAPATAAGPAVAMTTVVSSVICPDASAFAKAAPSRRCSTLPEGCADSSLRYSLMPHEGGSPTSRRGVRTTSRSTVAIALATHAREVPMAEP